jgi:hypothetical protein
MKHDLWPDLPYAAWKDTYATLHLWTQIVGIVSYPGEHQPIVDEALWVHVERALPTGPKAPCRFPWPFCGPSGTTPALAPSTFQRAFSMNHPTQRGIT